MELYPKKIVAGSGNADLLAQVYEQKERAHVELKYKAVYENFTFCCCHFYFVLAFLISFDVQE